MTITTGSACELTILMPCLNEARTLGRCIQKAQSFLDEKRISGEVLIADNGSTDGSQQIASDLGALYTSTKKDMAGHYAGGSKQLPGNTSLWATLMTVMTCIVLRHLLKNCARAMTW
jgi:glycosyltransferase involved in cell wall biosynthesis